MTNTILDRFSRCHCVQVSGTLISSTNLKMKPKFLFQGVAKRNTDFIVWYKKKKLETCSFHLYQAMSNVNLKTFVTKVLQFVNPKDLNDSCFFYTLLTLLDQCFSGSNHNQVKSSEMCIHVLKRGTTIIGYIHLKTNLSISISHWIDSKVVKKIM